MCTGAQVQEARKLLGWSVDRLMGMSRVNNAAILSFEKTGVMPMPRPLTLSGRENIDRVAVIRATLERAGIVFLDGDEPGVRLQKQAQQCGMEAPEGTLPHPVAVIEITVRELEALVAHHNDCAQICGARHEHGAETFHFTRATYLLQWLARIAPERVSPGKAEQG